MGIARRGLAADFVPVVGNLAPLFAKSLVLSIHDDKNRAKYGVMEPRLSHNIISYCGKFIDNRMCVLWKVQAQQTIAAHECTLHISAIVFLHKSYDLRLTSTDSKFVYTCTYEIKSLAPQYSNDKWVWLILQNLGHTWLVQSGWF